MLFKTAQKYWCPDKKLIPKKVFEALDGWKELLKVDLVSKRVGGYYARGSHESFAWLCQKYEAGRKSAELHKKKDHGIPRLTTYVAPPAPVLVKDKIPNQSEVDSISRIKNPVATEIEKIRRANGLAPEGPPIAKKTC